MIIGNGQLRVPSGTIKQIRLASRSASARARATNVVTAVGGQLLPHAADALGTARISRFGPVAA